MFRANSRRTGVFTTKCVHQLRELKWKFDTGGAVDSSPVVADGIVYVGSNCAIFYAIYIETGEEKWRFKAFVPHSSVVADGMVYFINSRGRSGGDLHAVDAETGQEKWKFDRAGAYSSPAFADGVIYIGSAKVLGKTSYIESYMFPGKDGIESYGLYAKNGNEKWRFEKRSKIIESLLTDSSHAIAEEVVCFASYDGYLYALDS